MERIVSVRSGTARELSAYTAPETEHTKYSITTAFQELFDVQTLGHVSGMKIAFKGWTDWQYLEATVLILKKLVHEKETDDDPNACGTV